MKKPRISLAREGYPFILFSGFVTLICAVLAYHVAALTGLAVTGFTTWFFRDPARVGPDRSDVLVSPADGKVILIDKIFDDRFCHDNVLKVSIFMNILNVHVNRIPFPGQVEQVTFKPGAFYSADSKRGALHNEYCALTIVTDSKQRYGVVQVAGLIARRIVCRAEKGDRVQTGQRYGLIRFGSRVDLYLPLQVELEISKGQKVRAGETVLGRMNSGSA